MSARSRKRRRSRRGFFRRDLERIARIWEVGYAPATPTKLIQRWFLSVIFARWTQAPPIPVGLPCFWYSPGEGFARRPYEHTNPEWFVWATVPDDVPQFADVWENERGELTRVHHTFYLAQAWGGEECRVKLRALLYLPKGEEGRAEHKRDMSRAMGDNWARTLTWLDRNGLGKVS